MQLEIYIASIFNKINGWFNGILERRDCHRKCVDITAETCFISTVRANKKSAIRVENQTLFLTENMWNITSFQMAVGREGGRVSF